MDFQQTTLDQLLAEGGATVVEPAPRSFSSLVLEKDCHRKKCPTCGHEDRVYRRTLRPCLIPALRALVEKGPMTTGELTQHFSGNGRLSASIKSYFAEATLWGFVEKNGDGRWAPTGKAGAFLRGDVQVFRHVWPRDQSLPDDCTDSELIFVNDLSTHILDERRTSVAIS